jgi:hypothetical protein
MTRRLRFNGTGSGGGSCPAIHEDLDTGEIIVHGPRLTDPDAIAQLQHLDEDEIPVVVPRNTIIDFGPKNRDTEPRMLDPETFARLFENFRHSAWHLEMRKGYAVDRATDTYAQFVRGEVPAWDMDSPWARTISAKTRDGAYVGRVRIVDNRRQKGSCTFSRMPNTTRRWVRRCGTCGVRTPSACTCPTRISGSSTRISSPCASGTTRTISRVPN